MSRVQPTTDNRRLISRFGLRSSSALHLQRCSTCHLGRSLSEVTEHLNRCPCENIIRQIVTYTRIETAEGISPKVSPEWPLVRTQWLFVEALAARRMGKLFHEVLSGQLPFIPKDSGTPQFTNDFSLAINEATKGGICNQVILRQPLGTLGE